MAKLTTRARRALPEKDFAGPGKSFPIEDKAHAVAAERLVGRSERAGNISAGEAAKIKSEARAKLAKGADAPARAKLGGKKVSAPENSMKGKMTGQDWQNADGDRKTVKNSANGQTAAKPAKPVTPIGGKAGSAKPFMDAARPSSTHDRDGFVFGNELKGAHHDGIAHTSKDR